MIHTYIGMTRSILRQPIKLLLNCCVMVQITRSNLKSFGHLNRFGQTNLGWHARLMRAWKARMSAHGTYSARHSRDMRAYARKHLIGPFTSGLLVPKLVRC